MKSILPAIPVFFLVAHAGFAQGKPLASSPVVSRQTAGHATAIEADITGSKKIWLVVTDGGDGFGSDWAVWLEPRIAGDFGEKKLTEMPWVSASADWGKVNVGKNPSGDGIVVDGKPQTEGIGAHANSVIEYDVPEGAKKFTARGALDHGGVSQAEGATVSFQIWNTKPKSARRAGGGGGLDPEAALAALTVADGLEAVTFAAEPTLLSPSSIDIDHRGRIWVAEIVNYRGHNGKRPEGDRILILEDKDGDGKSDEAKTFYQGKDMVSPHGICVLGDEVIVSVGDKVLRLTDADHDDKAEKVEVLFQGIHGVQHDHGIHAFHFGPDGKYYFNFGNEGRELKDKDGKPVVDLAGNEVNANRKPYQQGCVFRCNPDLTEVETLGWNFRNNWEACVDSFGTIWQSDNDDDGNKSVRINYVMEFGNYGYCDEMTGNGWSKGDAKTEEEVQIAHWHLKDPGVVPNLLQTGGGSPSGICINEGNLLPAEFHGQMIHCDPGPNVVRAYPVTPDGAGYKAEMKNLILGEGDKWFRPVDACVAPDGSVFVADWYDPGVGGHGMGDLERGRIYRLAPPNTKYTVEKIDVTTPDGAAAALQSPCEATRFLAWKSLKAMGDKAVPPLEKMWQDKNPIFRARALWLLSKIQGAAAVDKALADGDSNLRIVGLRAARQLKLPIEPIVAKLLETEKSPAVLRECAIALRHVTSPGAAKLWAKLASKHDGKDRWYLAALHIGANLHWDECFTAWLEEVGQKWSSPAGLDILFTSRAKKSTEYLTMAMKDPAVSATERLRLLRALDFQPKSAASDEEIKKLLKQ